jgi:hypothetical protein
MTDNELTLASTLVVPSLLVLAGVDQQSDMQY